MKQWRLNSSRAVGLSHIEKNIPCQDSVITIKKNGVSVAVLSDGCGSAHFAHYGSMYVVKLVSKYLCENFDELFQRDEEYVKRVIAHLILDNISTNLSGDKLVTDYLESEDGKKYQDKVSKYNIMSHLSKEDAQKLLVETLFDATVLFVAIKGNKCIIGHCGDGYILGYKNETFEIVSEEPKMGERNETNYPSSITSLSKAYKDESYWGLFRIQKFSDNEYVGFTLMSDGAERSLIAFKGKEASPVLKNNMLLYDMVSNETPENATKYLTELLEQVYRQRLNDKGEMIEITDDDVSVAIMLAGDFNDVQTESSDDEFAIPEKIVPKKMFYETKLKNMMFGYYGFLEFRRKVNFLDKAFRFLIEEYKLAPFGASDVVSILRAKMGLDSNDAKMVEIFAYKCGVLIKSPFSVVCDGGDSIGK